jgi:hypothetical protein
MTGGGGKVQLSKFGQWPYRLDSQVQRRVSMSVRPGRPPRKGRTMRISDFCFVAAAIAALGGMTLGMIMGLSQDFTLAPAHAHLNLLGWVTMAIYGLYHRGMGRVGGLVGWLQVGSGALGAGLMALGLGLYLSTGSDRLFALVIAGPLLAIFSMVLFAGLVVADIWRQAPSAFEAEPMSG